MEQLGVHLIDVLISLFGLPQEMHGWSENIPCLSDAPDWGHVSLSFDHGIHAAISTSFSAPKHLRMEFFFDRGHLATDGQTLWITHGNLKSKTIKPKGIRGGVAQFVEFADCIEHDQEPETSAVAAAAVMDAVSSIYSAPQT
jgi:predicted dehydrogenase